MKVKEMLISLLYSLLYIVLNMTEPTQTGLDYAITSYQLAKHCKKKKYLYTFKKGYLFPFSSCESKLVRFIIKQGETI